MVDTELENTVAGKGILKRRVRNVEKTTAAAASASVEEPNVAAAAAAAAARDGAANACGKRVVTFDETITVKNDKDLVVKKPLKLELVIDNWKSSGDGGGGGTKAAVEVARPDPGLVRRLVGEFNAVQDPPLTDNSEIDCALPPEELRVGGEDGPTRILQTDIVLCGALETVSLTTTDA